MEKDVWKKFGVIAQIVAILGGLIYAYVNLESRLSKIETNIDWIKTEISKTK